MSIFKIKRKKRTKRLSFILGREEKKKIALMHLKARKMHIKAFSFPSNNRKTRTVLSPSANSEHLIPQSTAVRQATQTITLEPMATSLGSTAHHYRVCRRRRDPQQRILSVCRLPSCGPARARSNALEKHFLLYLLF